MMMPDEDEGWGGGVEVIMAGFMVLFLTSWKISLGILTNILKIFHLGTSQKYYQMKQFA
jgi:hypothetical protein